MKLSSLFSVCYFALKLSLIAIFEDKNICISSKIESLGTANPYLLAHIDQVHLRYCHHLVSIIIFCVH